VDATGKSLHWKEMSGQVTVQLSPILSQRHCLIGIAPGVRERVCFVNSEQGQANTGRWITERLEFDRGQGWERAKAEEWLRAQCGFWSDARTVSLEPAPQETGDTPDKVVSSKA